MDTLGHSSGESIGLFKCHKSGGNQVYTGSLSIASAQLHVHVAVSLHIDFSRLLIIIAQSIIWAILHHNSMAYIYIDFVKKRAFDCRTSIKMTVLIALTFIRVSPLIQAFIFSKSSKTIKHENLCLSSHGDRVVLRTCTLTSKDQQWDHPSNGWLANM